MLAIDRLVPTDEGAELIELVREIASAELAPRAAHAEAAGEFPRDVFRLLGEAGVLGMPYPGEYGGADQPYEVYLQALEEIARAWMSVGVGVSVHVMTCFALSRFGTAEQRAALLPAMIAGEQLGAYALSEPQAGSDIAGITTRAKTADEGYALSGTKAWVTHGSQADFYTTFVRTGEHRTSGTQLLPRARRRARPQLRGAGAQDGSYLVPDQLPVLRHRARRRGAPDRPRGRRHADRPLRAGLRSARDRRLRYRTGAGSSRLRGRVRAGTGAVRPTDRASSRGWSSCWPRWPPRSTPPGPPI